MSLQIPEQAQTIAYVNVLAQTINHNVVGSGVNLAAEHDFFENMICLVGLSQLEQTVHQNGVAPRVGPYASVEHFVEQVEGLREQRLSHSAGD